MHMGNHSATSKYAFLNRLYGTTMDLIGASAFMWQMEHQVAHHMDPNETGKDNDCSIGSPVLRFSSGEKRKWWHKYQHILTLMIVCLGMPRWVFFEFPTLNTGKIGSVSFHITTSQKLQFLFFKFCYISRALVVPLYLHGLSSLLVWFFCLTATGYYLEMIFIVNHIQTGLDPPRDKHWSIKQCYATSNWGSGSVFWNWFSGGLNHQIEHHLFPSLSQYLFPYIAPIVIQTCQEFNVPYYHFNTFPEAWLAMARNLQRLGYLDDDSDVLKLRDAQMKNYGEKVNHNKSPEKSRKNKEIDGKGEFPTQSSFTFAKDAPAPRLPLNLAITQSKSLNVSDYVREATNKQR